jgi:hypothetical protein
MKWFGPPWRLTLCLETCGELYRNPMVSPVKLTQSVGCPKRVGSQVPRGPALLLRSLQGVFPRIKLTTLGVVLIKLSTTDQHSVYELTPSRSRQARNWKGQEPHCELRGICLFYDKKINVRLITRSTLTRPLARSLRGWFICQIEIAENKANLAISVLLCKRKN